jgi:hypothetical protein
VPSAPPPTYRLVSWPVRIAILLVALGAASMVLVTWAAGVRLSWMMTAVGERNAALDRAMDHARRDTSPGEPGIIYLDRHTPTIVPPAKPKGQ